MVSSVKRRLELLSDILELVICRVTTLVGGVEGVTGVLA